MEEVTASDAKQAFGDLLLKSQQEPVRINKNGKPVAVMVSATRYEFLEKVHEQYLSAAIQEGLDDVAAGRVHDAEDVYARLQKKIDDAKEA